MNSQLIKMEALLDGYEEGIALNIRGHVSEGSGENIFLVMDGTVLTPPLSSSVLPGITRDSVMTLFRDLGVRVVEETHPPRDALHRRRGLLHRLGRRGHPDPLGRQDHHRLRQARAPDREGSRTAFFEVIDGKRDDTHGWLTFV